MLTPEQQKLIEDNLAAAHAAVRNFKRSLPHLSAMLNNMDLQSAAYEGMCKAAKTYDPNKSTNAAGYMYRAGWNSMLHELKQEFKSGYHTSRADIDVSIMKADEESRAFECLYEKMTDQERDWLEHYAINQSRRALKRDFGEDLGIGGKLVSKMLDQMIERFREKYDDFPD